ncbi:MAG TPA: polysaccharide deacetylase family protein [Roseiflexaceae bacterium]|nr:polysaccharide deacetylase family protein [Roseiflexaceae bacterium]HMP41816.1 polysaccharide deacetylase family protein [Roseiflexaceae bacterium]
MTLWPHDYTAAISLTFDDGLESQRTTAFALLQEYGLRATFYLNPRGMEEDPQRSLPWREWLVRWHEHHVAGHEIGNHTLLHPCSLNNPIAWGTRQHLREWTLERMAGDIAEAQRRIAALFPGQAHTSFAYPCYESDVGHGAERISYTPLVARNFVGARAKGELRGDLANDLPFCDLHHLSSWPVEGQSGALMIGLAEQAIALGRWGIFTFHGIHEGNLSVAASDLAELLAYLARVRGVWVAPLAEIAAHVAEKR